jgi:hypothetical protein
MAAYEKAVADYNSARKINPKIDIARIMLNKIVIKTAYSESEDNEMDGDSKVECRWTKPIPFKKTVVCRTKEAWGDKPYRSKWIPKTTPSLPPHDGINQTMSPGEARDIYYGH